MHECSHASTDSLKHSQAGFRDPSIGQSTGAVPHRTIRCCFLWQSHRREWLSRCTACSCMVPRCMRRPPWDRRGNLHSKDGANNHVRMRCHEDAHAAGIWRIRWGVVVALTYGSGCAGPTLPRILHCLCQAVNERSADPMQQVPLEAAHRQSRASEFASSLGQCNIGEEGPCDSGACRKLESANLEQL